jgi:hypothetical protein
MNILFIRYSPFNQTSNMPSRKTASAEPSQPRETDAAQSAPKAAAPAPKAAQAAPKKAHAGKTAAPKKSAGKKPAAVPPAAEAQAPKALKAPKAAKPAKAVKPVKSVKAPRQAPAAEAPAAEARAPKLKLVRDSFTIPRTEYQQIEVLKLRLVTLLRPTKKSELLRAGVKLLASLADDALLAAVNEVPAIKTGRPGKA